MNGCSKGNGYLLAHPPYKLPEWFLLLVVSMIISSIVITYNSELHIQTCLDSLTWTDEIILVDLGSKDATLEIAREFPVKIIFHEWVPFADTVRDLGAKCASGEWVFHVDPDECVPATLAERLREITQEDEVNTNAVRMPRRNIMFGRWMKYGGMWTDPQIRFGRKDEIHFSGGIHQTGISLHGQLLELPDRPEYALIHHPVSSINDLIERINRYAHCHAKEKYQSGAQFQIGKLFADPLFQFYQAFIQQQGYRDGTGGLILALCWHVLYPMLINIYLWELSGYPGIKVSELPHRSTASLVRYLLHERSMRDVLGYILRSEIPALGRFVNWITRIWRNAQANNKL
jgi:(heptosyl)LPS beta-1,4-glucosyltransferase